MTRSSLFITVAFGVAIAGGGGCSRPGGPFEVTQSEFPVPDAGMPITVVTPPPAKCNPVQSSEMIPPRSSVTAASAGMTMQSDVELTSQLYGLFKSVCGGCHVESALGNPPFSVNQTNFSMVVTNDVYNIIFSNDSNVVMPPVSGGGVPFNQRQPSDAVYQLATQLRLWLDQGRPAGSFTLPSSTSGASAGYAIGTALGAQLTNIGSCVPEKAMVATDPSGMDQLDAMFAQATALPATLAETDLTTLDSAALAQNGVISYAPTYPLWSDNAQKMRYIRVPRGKSVVFDKASQTFQIPPNTRFYKTFLKQVTDVSGDSTYRKIETRLIVSRPDTTLSDGSAQQNAIFGTYVWNPEETQASLLTDPLRDGKPFADRIFSYVTNEQRAQPIIDKKPANLQAALDAAGITRHYALPGSERCIQCHMGSPSQSFVLGFTPLQVARRPSGEGGVYEPAVGDELTQLQRLIDYGVISGMKSPSDVLPLESAEGTRAPRNVHELNAQAYMVGNCAHCHNPRGFPSVKQPELKDVLVFLPGAGPNQGIFQFPLETVSPIRKRGSLQDVPIPYITPSVYDMSRDTAVPKYFCPDQPSGSCGAPNAAVRWVLAPWRSLIYRNVDTPYDYFDDSTLFPHMPLNTSGYDCRVAGLMGDWMVSIPSRIKDPTKFQSALPVEETFPSYANVDPQPYEEAHPGDSDYDAAVGAASSRLQQYHNTGFRYGFCPPTYTADIIDPVVQSEADLNQAVQADLADFYSPIDPSYITMPEISPISPHYISFDDTDPAGDWFPRRPDWATALVNPNIPAFIAAETAGDNLQPDAAQDLENVMTALQNVTLTAEVRNELTKQYPLGLWDTTVPGCDFSKIPTVGSFTGADVPAWIATSSPPPPANAPVYMASAGAAIFTSVCFNCHGINADSKGLLADEITNLTGGDARVANFRDGLLGPLTAPGAAREMVFGPSASTLGITTDDLTARYMAWMSLGGTAKHLPQEILAEVSASLVLGQERVHVDQVGTPDMLRLALSLCEQLVSADPYSGSTPFTLSGLIASGHMDWSDNTGLIDANGDGEMWLRLCNLGNRQIVRVARPPSNSWTPDMDAGSLFVDQNALYWATDPTSGADFYGPNPVMDHRGSVETGVTAANLYPLCVQKPTDPTQLQYATQVLQRGQVLKTNTIPFCPDGFVQASHKLTVDADASPTNYIDGRKWAARGAINAALAVFLYLNGVENNPAQRQPLYSQCNLIGTGK
jgi:mono/diheme cytochrome c family protein